MIHGLMIEEGPQDWQIVQAQNGSATVRLGGTWLLHPEAVQVGVAEAHPVVRVMREDDGYPVVPWLNAENKPNATAAGGSWSIVLEIPAGGLYRIETGLRTVSTQPGLAWMFRGDVRLHVGVGDVFIVAGQSNAAGYGRDNAYDPPAMQVHLLRNRGSWDLACHPMNEATQVTDMTDCDRGVSGSSPYLSFGKRFSESSHRPVGLVATALGGQPIRRWDTRLQGDLFCRMLEKIRACGSSPAGVLWYQGCSDTTKQDAPAYGERFAYMVAQLRQELGYEIPIFTFQLNRELTPGNDRGYAMVREAQRRAAHEIPGVYVLPTLDCDLSDGIHNTGHSNLRLGERLARQCTKILLAQPAPVLRPDAQGMTQYNAPDIIDAFARNTTLTLRFANLVGSMALRTGNVALCGLTVQDEQGEIAVTRVYLEAAQPDALLAELERAPGQNATVSYLWQANPTHVPALDDATFLPPLAFYRYPVSLDGNV